MNQVKLGIMAEQPHPPPRVWNSVTILAQDEMLLAQDEMDAGAPDLQHQHFSKIIELQVYL